MSKTVKIPVMMQSGEARAEAAIQAAEYAGGERVRRAAAVWVIGWLCAGAAVFIPVAHFILVPALLIAGPVLAYKKYQASSVPESIAGKCPAHGGEVTIRLEGAESLPFWVHCPECNASLHVEALERPGAG